MVWRCFLTSQAHLIIYRAYTFLSTSSNVGGAWYTGLICGHFAFFALMFGLSRIRDTVARLYLRSHFQIVVLTKAMTANTASGIWLLAVARTTTY